MDEENEAPSDEREVGRQDDSPNSQTDDDLFTNYCLTAT